MADGSVVIGVTLDASAFASQSAALETQIAGLGERIGASLTASLNGAGLASSLAGTMAGVTESVAASAQAAAEAVRSAAASAVAEFVSAGWSEAGYSAMSALAGGVSAGGGAVNGAVSSVSSQARSAFSGGGWSSVGSEIMNGVASGILAAGASVTAAIERVAADAEKAVKDFYGIASPSRLMRDEVGVMISRGIAEGILDGASFVDGAMNAVYADSLGGGGSRIPAAEGGRQVTQNIYLRDSDSSPYRTARRIRRESEAIFR